MGLFSLIKPLRKYEDYVFRANTLESFFLKKKAIETMKMAVEQPFRPEELSSGFIYLGILYKKSKDFQAASDSYHRGLELMVDKEFSYHPNFIKGIEAFLRNGDDLRAAFWLENLLSRQRYDERFGKLERLKAKLE